MTSRETWNHLYSLPWTNVKSISQCMSLERTEGEALCRLTLANLNIEDEKSIILTYSKNGVMSTINIPELVSGVLHFQIGPDDMSQQALAVSAGSKIYIYKNLRPFYCHNLPESPPSEEETNIWKDFLSDDDPNLAAATEAFKELLENGIKLTLTSRTFLVCGTKEFLESLPKNKPLCYQSVICCMSSIKKRNTNLDEIDHLIIGTQDCELYIIETTSFRTIRELQINDIPVFISCYGPLNMMCDIFVSTRLSYIYLIETNNFKAKVIHKFTVPIIGIFSTVEGIIVATQDQFLQMHNTSGRKIWSEKMPAEFVNFRGVYFNMVSEWLLIVVLRDKQIRLYNKKNLCSVLNLEYQVQAVAFGRYGKFNNVLIGVSEGGGLEMFSTPQKTFLNSVTYDPSRKSNKKKVSQLVKLLKNKIPGDRTREDDDFINIHKVFNHDFTFMKLRIIKEFISASETNHLPVTDYNDMKLKVVGEFEGIGPTFILRLDVQNVGSETEVINIFVTFDYDESNYELNPNMIQVPMIPPGLSYKTKVGVSCLEDVGFSGIIKTILVNKNHPHPLIVADFEVPPNEGIDI